MSSLEEDFDFAVGRLLFSTAESRNFRLNHGIVGDLFHKAFSENGFTVFPSDERRSTDIGYRHRYKRRRGIAIEYFHYSIPYDSIYKPFPFKTPTTLTSYEIAMRQVLTRLKPISGENISSWKSEQKNISERVENTFRNLVKRAFNEYHEDMFVSVDGEVRNNSRKRILRQIIREEDLILLREASGSEIESEKDEDSKQVVSYKDSMKYYLGMYLSRLADEKGYEPMDDAMDLGPYEYFSKQLFKGLKNARELSWKI